MKKTIISLFLLILGSTSAFSAGMIGAKLGFGSLEATKNEITNTPAALSEGAQTQDVSHEYGAIFAELNLGDTPLALGVEFIPVDGTLSASGRDHTDASVEISDHTTVYALASKELNNGASLYGKIGYSMADIGNVKQNTTTTTITSHSGELEGVMAGIGLETAAFSPMGVVARLEATYTEYDDVNVKTTDSDGLVETKKASDINLTTFTVSIGKKF